MRLTYGGHASHDGQCLVEAAAILGGEEKSDHPVCVCPVLRNYGIRLNDGMGMHAEGDALRETYLADLAPRLVDTVGDSDLERIRGYILLDAAVREFLPLLHPDHAGALRGLPVIDCYTGIADALRVLGQIEEGAEGVSLVTRAIQAIHAPAWADAAGGVAKAAKCWPEARAAFVRALEAS